MASKSNSEVSRLEMEFDRIGLLLQHDKALPSATTIIAGAPITGSWWGHPKGKRIYDVLESLSDGPLALCVKLVNGKRTYVHPRLWTAFLVLATHREERASQNLSPLARVVLDRVKVSGRVGVEALAGEGVASARDLTRAAGEIEDRLLLHVGSVHAASGAHYKVLETWSGWAEAKAVQKGSVSVTTATGLLRAAVDELFRGAKGLPKVALF
jgi:hypothetical protein